VRPSAQKAGDVTPSFSLEDPEGSVVNSDDLLRKGPLRFTRPFTTTVLLNKLAAWNQDAFGIWLEPGVDEVALALVADAWSRTFRSRSRTLAASLDAVESRTGLRTVPDQAETNIPQGGLVSIFPDVKPANALDAKRQCSNCPRWRKLFAAAVHESRLDCGFYRFLPSICLGATRTGVSSRNLTP
jgi:hypothetical protein